MQKGKTRLDFIVDRYVSLNTFYNNQKPAANGCIEWTGITNNAGYPFIGFVYPPGVTSPSGHKSGMMTSTRLAFMIYNKRLPTKRNVNHTCHNKLCVNPDHLVEGTQQEKLEAMRRDGIHSGRNGPIGSYNHKQHNRKYRYTDEEIQWHRRVPVEEIMEKYKITRQKAHSKQWAFKGGYKWLPWEKE